MLPFFRKIRRSLIKSGKVSRYIFYAAGEIALVVIGILIALAANSTFDQMRQSQRAHETLQALHNDLTNDLRQLEEYWLPQNDSIIQGRERLKTFLSTDVPIQDSVQFVIDVIWTTFYGTYDPHTTTIEELKSSGNLGLIRNQELRAAILGYYNELENVFEFDMIHRAYFTEQYGRLAPKIVKEFALTEIFYAIASRKVTSEISISGEYLDASYLRSTDFLRELLESTGAPSIIKLGGYKSLRVKAMAVIDLINEELESSK